MAKCSRAVENFKYTNIETSDCELFVNFECVCVRAMCMRVVLQGLHSIINAISIYLGKLLFE